MIRWITNLIPQNILILLWRYLPIPKKMKKYFVKQASRQFLVAVLGIIENEKGEVLLLKHTYRSEPWGIPSGWMEYEEPENGLVREIYEETQLKVEINGLLKATYLDDPHRVDLYYRGRIVSGGKFKPSYEVSEYGFFDIDGLPDGLPANQKKIITNVLKKGGF